jgi:hypothetical protein
MPTADPISSLLTNDLGALLLPILLIVRALRKKFMLDPGKPTIPEIVITIMFFVAGFGLAYANVKLHPEQATALTQVAWVQGLLFGGALLFADMGFDATSVKTAEAVRARAAVGGLLIPLLLMGGLLLPRKAAAEDRSWYDVSRLSAGPRVVAQVYDFDSGGPREFGFCAGGVASWNVTSLWDVNGSLERKFNPGIAVPPHWRGSIGLAVLLPFSGPEQQWFLGFERAWYRYSGPEAPTWTAGTWVARVQWSFGIAGKDKDLGYAIARGRYDVDDGRRDYGLGAQPQLLGGK